MFYKSEISCCFFFIIEDEIRRWFWFGFGAGRQLGSIENRLASHFLMLR
jgi:hypothetical protein